MSNDVTVLARELAQAHASGEMVVLPTVWDAWSAGMAVEAGFTGLTVGSHPVANALGRPDGEHLDFGDYLAVVARITASVPVPVSADVESGYGLAPQELIQRVLEAGAVGVNIEDTVHREGDRVREVEEHADYIAAARAAGDEAGVEVVINGRTDALVHGSELSSDPLGEAVRRCIAMEAAGARSVYPVGLPDAAAVTRLVDAVSVPVNVTAHPVQGHPAGGVEQLRSLGVRRVSFGPLWQAALSVTGSEQLGPWAPHR